MRGVFHDCWVEEFLLKTSNQEESVAMEGYGCVVVGMPKNCITVVIKPTSGLAVPGWCSFIMESDLFIFSWSV